MGANDKFESKIDDYLLNRLTIKDMNSFEEQIINDKALRQKTEAQKEIIDGIESYGKIELKKKLKKIHSEIFENTNSLIRKTIGISIVATIIILALYFVFSKQNSLSDPNKLYLAYFEPFDYSTTKRSESQGSLFTLGVLYNQKKYSELISRFEQSTNIPLEQPSDLLLAIGIAYLEEDKPSKARDYFNIITQKNDFNFSEEVKWYSAMSYLKEGDFETVKSLIKYFVDDKSTFFHDQATQLNFDLK